MRRTEVWFTEGGNQVRGRNDQRESRPPNPESDAREGEVRGIFLRMSRAVVRGRFLSGFLFLSYYAYIVLRFADLVGFC